MVAPLALLALLACTGPPPPGRVVILGFDGLDPDAVEAWRADLPNLAEAMDAGRLARLGTTTPPQSPVAWATFATSRNPGAHGIFDFVTRTPRNHLLDVATSRYTPPRYGPDGRLAALPQAENLRDGTPFWVTAAKAGVSVGAFAVPYSFPVDDLGPEGRGLGGLGIPDLRGTNSTFTWFGEPAEDDRPSGGRRVTLEPRGDAWVGVLEGPVGPHGGPVGLELAFVPEADTVSFALQGQAVRLREGEISGFLTVQFPLAQGQAAQAWVRVALVRLGAPPTIYVSPLMIHPDAPWMLISHPPELAQELAARGGPYRTVGWVHDTAALNGGLLPEGMFVEHLTETFERRLAMTLAELERENPARLLVSVFTAPDRAAHMFTRLSDPAHPAYDAALAADYGGVIRGTYALADRAIGQVRARLGPRDVLIVLSDHGFHPFNRALHVNAWLKEHGYLALTGPQREDSALYKKDIDWANTRAYALGTGQVFLNLKGRERFGIVAPADAAALAAELREGLLALVDPATGERPLVDVIPAATAWSGPHVAGRAPDLQLAFAPGYQASRRTTLGGVPPGLFEPNDRKWSGDHAASDAAQTEGLIAVWGPGASLPEAPHIADVAPTTLRLLGVSVPTDYEGVILFGR